MSFSDATAAVSDELAARDDIIVCDSVDKWYGDFQALKGVSATSQGAGSRRRARSLGIGEVDLDPLPQPAGGASERADHRRR